MAGIVDSVLFCTLLPCDDEEPGSDDANRGRVAATRRVAAESDAVQSPVVVALVLRRRRLSGDGVAVPPSRSPSERVSSSAGGLVLRSACEKADNPSLLQCERDLKGVL